MSTQISVRSKESMSAGLTSGEVREQIGKLGTNSVLSPSMHPWRRALGKFWAPVPWMLELAVLIQLVLGKYAEGAVIAGLLIF